MKHEKSCGVIVFTRKNGEIKYVVIESINGFFGFPKGHVENGETEKQTALREVFEEVGLNPVLIDGFRETVEYYIPFVDVQKQVVYFLGEFENQEIVFQKEELSSAQLLSFDEANNKFTHENNKELLLKAHLFLTNI
jgi:8-oxo-dGTP pyrophosphatase MutT (NUDIX family)